MSSKSLRKSSAQRLTRYGPMLVPWQLSLNSHVSVHANHLLRPGRGFWEGVSGATPRGSVPQHIQLQQGGLQSTWRGPARCQNFALTTTFVRPDVSGELRGFLSLFAASTCSCRCAGCGARRGAAAVHHDPTYSSPAAWWIDDGRGRTSEEEGQQQQRMITKRE